MAKEEKEKTSDCGIDDDFAGSDGGRNWWDDPRGWPGWRWKGQKKKEISLMKNLKKCRFALPSLPPWWATRRRPNCCRSVSESLFMWVSDLNYLRNNPPCLTFGRLGILASNDTTLYLLSMTKGLSMFIIADAKAILILEMIWMNTMAQIVMPTSYDQWKRGVGKLKQIEERNESHSSSKVESFDAEEEDWGGIYETTFGLHQTLFEIPSSFHFI